MSKDFVECRVCGNKYVFITWNHLQKHNLNREDYKKLFPNASLVATGYRGKRRKQALSIFSDPTIREKLSEAQTRRWKDPAEHKRRSKKSTEIWSKPEVREMIIERMKESWTDEKSIPRWLKRHLNLRNLDR